MLNPEIWSVIKGVDEESRTQFRLKPGGLGRHDFPRIGDVDELLNGGRIHGESDGPISAVDAPFKFLCATDSADEINAIVRAGIPNAELGTQDAVLENGHVEAIDGAL